MAEKFVAEGAYVIATGRRKERLDKLASELGAKLLPVELDVRENWRVVEMLKLLPKEWQNIDVLVNNAGLALGLESADQASLENWETMIDTNIKGVLNMTHALLPKFVAANNGHIINIGSIAGNYPYPGGNVYGGTKAFLKAFSLNLKADLLGKNIRITNIEPGMVETEFSLVRFKGDQVKAGNVYSGMQPLTANDIADCVMFALTAPAHVNINRIEVMPVAQAFGPFTVNRKITIE